MSLALARKYRPRSFAELVGQEHVVRALTNALDQSRLHHAYLFTGTRGVGKTTLARILAKAFNCEVGVSAQPCGQCTACTEIDGGRFVDLLEMDAASNTQVDQMRELLERALYAPTRARFKVYIIDEVHMLSRSAFNAMLKTLEEPPAHVKFILATTDPHRVPVTVLSRCLQFALKQIQPAGIRQQLAHVLALENIDAETTALALLARAAQGSMRDALSLLDQAIVHGGGKVEEGSVREMLGVVDRGQLLALLEALAAGNGQALVSIADDLHAVGASFEEVLSEMASALHRLALSRSIPGALPEDEPDLDALRALAQRFSAEELQLFYQIAIHGRGDLGLAPDHHAGFTMTLLRMLTFKPEGARATTQAASAGAMRAAASPRVAAPAPRRTEATTKATTKATTEATTEAAAGTDLQVQVMAQDNAALRVAEAVPATPVSQASVSIDDWPSFIATLKLGGMAAMLAQHCALVEQTRQGLTLRLPEAHRHLLDKSYRDRLQGALESRLGGRLSLQILVGDTEGRTPAEIEAVQRRERLDKATASIEKDPFVRELVENFDARIVSDSIRPLQ